jgi:hypothetical protein
MLVDLENEAKLKEENEHLNKYIKWVQANHRRRYEILKKTDSLILDIMMLRSSHDIKKDYESAKKTLEALGKLIEDEEKEKPCP